METPRSRLDPLALAVLGAAALAGLALVAWLVVSIRSAPAPEPAKAAAPGALERAADAVKRLIGQFEERTKPAPPARPKPPASKPPGPAAKPAAPATGRRLGIDLPPGYAWTYAVRLEPEVWKDAALTYRSVLDSTGLVVEAEFRHSQGKLDFRLGNYAAGHRSHAQLRFPGFFMHGAYLDFPLTPGKRFAWEYPWQARDNSIRPGRVRRFEASVGAMEPVSVPAGRYDAVRIDVKVRYVDGGKDLASVDEILWYAPSIRQLVKVVRSGSSPDEKAQRIVADLAEVR